MHFVYSHPNAEAMGIWRFNPIHDAFKVVVILNRTNPLNTKRWQFLVIVFHFGDCLMQSWGDYKERDQGVESPLEGSGVDVYRANASHENSVFGNLYPSSLWLWKSA